ncbi:MAG: hypothetical protein DWH78_15540 [Planctomycetota bacterium]|nr:MAG: hypothetical protein DWH78_15540 [Planctomycetota bacterium]
MRICGFRTEAGTFDIIVTIGWVREFSVRAFLGALYGKPKPPFGTAAVAFVSDVSHLSSILLAEFHLWG